MDILVTGAGGQLAHDLIPGLSAAGFGVRAFDSRSLDITDRDKVLRTVKGIRPGFIVNAAAYTKVDLAEKERERAFAVNRDGAANVAEAAREANSPLIHISTDFVFDGARPAPYKETDPVAPLGVYGESKLAGEEEVSRRLREHVIVRTSWLYGAWGNNFVRTILRLASEREALRVVYDQVGCPTWTNDLAGAIVKIIRAHEGGKREFGLYHYSNEGVASWYDLAVAAVEGARGLGFEIRCRTIEPILTSGYPTPARRPAYSVFDKSMIKKTFGLSIPHWRTSLDGMLQALSGKGAAYDAASRSYKDA